MSTRILFIALCALSGRLGAVETDACAKDVAPLNAPGFELGGTVIDCDASAVGPGELNECGMMRWAEKNSRAFQNTVNENNSYIEKCGKHIPSCAKGKFSAEYLEAQLRMALVELSGMSKRNEPPLGPVSMRVNVACERQRKGLPLVKKPKDAVFLSHRFSFTRDVADPHSSRGKPFEAPFVINAVRDSERDTSSVGIYGTVGYLFGDVPGEYNLSASAKIDSAAGSERKKSSVTVGLNWQKYYWSETSPWFDHILFRVSPAYLTDRAFDREIYQVSAVATLASKRFGRPGYKICPEGCDFDNSYEFFWSPSLTLDTGKVVDAAGSEALLAMEGEDAYVRLSPGITMTFSPMTWSPKLSFQLQYAQRFDLTEGWNRGLGTLSMSYAIAPNAFWSLSWRKGRQDGSFEPVDSLLLGIGIRQ